MKKILLLAVLFAAGCSTPNLMRDCTEKCSSNGGMTCESVILGGNNPLYACKPRSNEMTRPQAKKSEAPAAKEDVDLSDDSKPATKEKTK